MKKQILAVSFFIWFCTFLYANSDPIIRYLNSLDDKDYNPCLKSLNGICINNLKGSDSPFEWQISNKVGEEELSRIWNAIEKGERKPISIGFRLCIILDGVCGEGSMQSVGKSIESNPEGFLIGYKEFNSLFKTANESGRGEEFYATRIIYGMMFDYVDEPEKKLIALKKREALIKNVENKDLIAAREEVLDYLNKGILQTQEEVDLIKNEKNKSITCEIQVNDINSIIANDMKTLALKKTLGCGSLGKDVAGTVEYYIGKRTKKMILKIVGPKETNVDTYYFNKDNKLILIENQVRMFVPDLKTNHIVINPEYLKSSWHKFYFNDNELFAYCLKTDDLKCERSYNQIECDIDSAERILNAYLNNNKQVDLSNLCD